jgi:hypothetical protein
MPRISQIVTRPARRLCLTSEPHRLSLFLLLALMSAGAFAESPATFELLDSPNPPVNYSLPPVDQGFSKLEPLDLNPPPSEARPRIESQSCDDAQPWTRQVMPQGIIYESYMAGQKEPRFASFWNQNDKMGWLWDVALGGRIGLYRWGNEDPNWPEGWQVDLAGGVFPRLNPNEFSSPLIGSDYRIGLPVTYGGEHWQFKIGYDHISAHLGDEWLLLHPGIPRINYVRDGIVAGAGYFVAPELRLYGEVGVSVVDGGAKPVEFQFGFEWAQARDTGLWGGPFVAFNTDLRQEVDFGGNISVQWGWMWRKYARGSNFRIGGQYFYGKSEEFEFFRQTESQLGWGLWCDF